MFVRKSKYDDLELKYSMLEYEYKKVRFELSSTIVKLSTLIREINRKGGQQFLDEGIIPKSKNQNFTLEDVKKLLQLCHPDKHDNKPISTEMTSKLLSIRNTLK